jgi:hypothetical protein
MSAVRMGRAFSPENRLGNPTQGVALGWYGTGPLALGHLHSAPTAQPHTSLGHRPRYAATNNSRAKGPSYTSEGQRPSAGASPQERNHPTKRRAEGPFHRIAGCEIGHQFRGVTKLIPPQFPQQIPAAGFYQGVFTPRSQGKVTVKESLTVQIKQPRSGTAEESSVVQTAGGKGIGRAFSPREIVSTGFLGRCPRLVWRWAFGPETETAPTARFHTSLGQRPGYKTPTRIEG